MGSNTLAQKIDEATTINISELGEIMAVARQAEISLLVLGKPGIGKSQVAQAFARNTPPSEAAMKLLRGNHPDRDHLHYHETRFSYAAPTDVRGWPNLTKDTEGRGRMSFAIPIDYPMEPGSMWHLEEMMCGSSDTMKAALQLLLEKRIGEYRCPVDTMIFASGNRLQDYADVETLTAPTMDRLMVVVLEVDHKVWMRWAMDPSNEIDPRVASFVYFFPHLLHNMPVQGDNSDEDWDGVSQFATPRSYEFVSRALGAGVERLSDRARLAAIEGLLGRQAGVQFDLYLQAEKSLPARDEILRHPSTAKVPTDIAGQACVCSGLAASFNRENCQAYLTYLDRMPNADFFAYALQYAHTLNAEVLTIPAFANLMTSRPELFRAFDG